MAKSESAKLVDAIIKEEAWPLLNSRDWKRKARTFVMESEALTVIIHFQSSKWSNPAEARITVNLRFFHPVAYRLVMGTPDAPKSLSTCNAVYDTRIGFLMPNPSDHWWTVSVSDVSMTNAVRGEILSAVRDLALPFIEQHLTIPSLLKIMEPKHPLSRHGRGYCRVILLALDNRHHEARRLLNHLAVRPGRPGPCFARIKEYFGL
jgi:hypothetical protein